jgi:formylglycine-generating enzyme required for sulfatase activity
MVNAPPDISGRSFYKSLSGFGRKHTGKLSTKQPGGEFTTSTGLNTLWCPPRSFSKGYTKDPRQIADPMHLVLLSTGFWMCQHEVTQEEWESITGQSFHDVVESALESQHTFLAGNTKKLLKLRDGFGFPMTAKVAELSLPFLGPKKAACFVDWNAAVGFCNKLTSLERGAGKISKD